MKLALIIAVAAVGAVGYAYKQGYSAGEATATASALSAQAIATQAANSATNAAIEAIKGIKIEHKHFTKQLDTVVKTEPVYLDCKHEPATVKLLNSALAGNAN